MREVPECLNRRYQALDGLIKELSTALSGECSLSSNLNANTSDPALRLMCDFWNILKEDPNCNLSQQVQQRMGLVSHSSCAFRPQHITCYMAGRGTRNGHCDKIDRRKEPSSTSKSSCCRGSEAKPRATAPKSTCCSSRSFSPSADSDTMPLSKVLCNLKDAASFDKKCNVRINDLMETQKELKEQIQHLEQKEQEGVKRLKQADCMWTCMEDAYKKKIAETLERQNDLLKQLKEVEASTKKWRKNKKDLEAQLDNINKCHQEITEKIHQKTNDIKCLDIEIVDLKKRIESNQKEKDALKKSMNNRKQASDSKMANIASELSKLNKIVSEETKQKHAKEKEGKQYVKEAREDLQKICRVLLQKRIENEDLLAEKDALLEEINLLKQTCDLCKDKCKNKQQTINDEISKLEKEIAEYKFKCIRCHQCIDTADVRKFCTDCPKCMEERDCLYEDDHCNPDHTMDCVCMSVKQKFLNNVFENMYTVLEKQSNTGPGKAVAESVLNCLKRSRNGKLNEETRKILQDFILNTVKMNLNLTIVGGAVKTRCEMDAETYKQLMVCLNKVKVTRPPREDKGTAVKKESCSRWGGTSECNCPKGPKACVCTKKAPPPPQDPTPCPPSKDKEDAGKVVACPHKDSTACGPDCAMHAVPSRVESDVAKWRPAPCKGESCTFSKNMRAAQCVLGPESLSSLPKSYRIPPYIPDVPVLQDLIICKCGDEPMKPCTCREDAKQLKVGKVNNCDMGTCATNWQEQLNNSNRKRSLIIKDTHKESHADYYSDDYYKSENGPNIQINRVTKSQEDSTIGKYVNTSDIIYEDNIIEIKPNDQFKRAVNKCDEYVELKNTTSGSLIMELNENIIDLIEKKTKENSNMFAYLNKSSSGHLIVKFDRKRDNANDISSVSFKRTQSGTRYLKVNKDFANRLKNGNYFSSADEYIPEKSSSYHNVHKKEDNFPAAHKKMINASSQIKKCSFKIPKDGYYNVNIVPELLELFENSSKTHITLAVQEKTSEPKKIIASLTRSLSGHIALNIKDTVSNLVLAKEQPVLLNKTYSGELILDLDNTDKTNSVLKRTMSGRNLLVLIDSVTMEDIKSLNEPTASKKFVRARINTKENIVDPPVIFNVNPSRNYLLVVDKENEKIFSKHIFHQIDTAKSSSDSQLYDKIKFKLNNQRGLLNGPIKLRKTNSGYYAIILNKEPKKVFANNLKNYLSNSQSVVPIKRSESGEIISNNVIEDKDSKGHNGALKITPSGNIFEAVDEIVFEKIKTFDNSASTEDTKSKHIIDFVRYPVNKVVATSCNAKPDGYICDPSQCVCKELMESQCKVIHHCKRNDNYEGDSKDIFDKISINISDFNKSRESNVMSDTAGKNDMEPHIVINPYDGRVILEQEPKSTESYNLMESVCSYHRDRCKTVSNELLKISGLCDKPQDKRMQSECEVNGECHDNENWDSLNYMPPQLPPFLRDFCYR